MKITFYFNLLGFLVATLIFVLPMLSFSETNDRISVQIDGRTKQYDVIETKQYKIVEVENSENTPDGLGSIIEQAISDAEKDASAHLNKTLWFSTGFFFPVVGTVLSQWYQPFMPTARVLGKSPTYVAFYYDAYKVKTKKLQFNWAFIGCLVGTPIGSWLLTALQRD